MAARNTRLNSVRIEAPTCRWTLGAGLEGRWPLVTGHRGAGKPALDPGQDLIGSHGWGKRKDWRPATRARLPKRATIHLEQGRELLKEAKSVR
jgi:hypothetical protein